MPDLLGNVGLLSRIILQLTAQEHNCTRFRPRTAAIQLKPWCTWVSTSDIQVPTIKNGDAELGLRS